MSVVSMGAHRNKGALTVLRELLILASRGKIKALRFEAELHDGTRRCGVVGELMHTGEGDEVFETNVVRIGPRKCRGT